MLLVPMSALADAPTVTVDYVYDKITITGDFADSDDKIATLVVLKPDQKLENFKTEGAEVIEWADQCIVKDGKVEFVVDTSYTEDNTYEFVISVPGVAETINGEFSYSEADMSVKLMEKLANVTDAGIDEFIKGYGANRITELDDKLVADYTKLSNPMKVAKAMIGERPYADLSDFVSKLRALVNKQSSSGSSGGSSGGSGGGGGVTVTPPISVGADAVIIAPPTIVENPFKDIADSYWGKDAIINLYNKDIVKGQGNGYFRPDYTVTRGEFVQMVVKAFGFEVKEGAADFVDVSSSDWFANAVRIANANGIVNGTSATTFSPLANITRQDMMTILYNAAKAKGVNLTNGSASFTDASDISAYAEEAVAAMVGSNVVSGYTDGSVKPLNNASRAEAAAMLSRLLEVM